MSNLPLALRSVKTATLAHLLSISSRRVNQLVVERVLVRDAQGGFDPAVAVPAYIGYRERTVRAEMGDGEYAKARIAYMQEKAAAARNARLEAEGKSPFVAEMQEHLTAFCTYLRTRLLAQPTRLAPQLAGLTAPLQAFKILTDDMYEMLSLIGGDDGKRDLEQWWEKTRGGAVEETSEDGSV